MGLRLELLSYTYDDGGNSYDPNAYYDAATGCYAARHVRLFDEQLGVAYGGGSGVAGRAVDYAFGSEGSIDDILSRVTAVTQSGTLATYKYLGTDQIVTRDDPQIGVTLDYSANNFAALDRFGRVVDQLWAAEGVRLVSNLAGQRPARLFRLHL